MPENGKHRLVKWADAVDAAALLLALTVLSHRFPESGYNFGVVPWCEVKCAAARKLESRHDSLTDIGELKFHLPVEGMEGFRKRLRACMDESAFKCVHKLAAEFESKGRSGLEKWRNDSQIMRWFDQSRI